MTNRVLIVEDSSYTTELIRRSLEDDFEIVGEATDGAEALELYKELEPDIVVMDIVMPISNGIKATAQIKKYDPDSKVVIVTGVKQREQKKKAAAAGADDYLEKPVTPGDLQDSLKKLTG